MNQDWHNYTTKLNQAIGSVDRAQISSRNKKLIIEFKDRLVVEGLSKARIIKYLYNLKKLAEWLKKDFDKASKKDLISLVGTFAQFDYSEWTKHSYKVVLKRFYKWLRNSEEEYPEEVRWIKAHVKKDRLKLPNEGDLLSESDIKKLLENAESIRDKAFVSCLWESGCRIGELANIRFKDVVFDDYGCVMCVDGKTGPRKIRLVTSTSYLANWMSIHPKSGQRNSSVWVNEGTRNRGQQMKAAGIAKMLRFLFNKAGIKKKCNPHSFRHARATFLANHLTEFQMNQYFGWVQGSDMPSTYVHLSGREIDGALLKLNGIQIDQKDKKIEIKAKECPRCRKINSDASTYCAQCGGILDITEAVRIQEESKKKAKRRGATEEVLTKLLDDPEIQKVIKAKLMTMGL